MRDAPIPRWLSSADEIAWPTSVHGRPDIGVASIAIPDHWRSSDRSMSGTMAWLGPFAGEGLVISTIDNAETSTDLAAWVEAEILMSGPGDPFLQPSGVDAVVLDWLGSPDDPALNEQFAVDESLTFVGLLRLELDRPELIRTYALLLRRAHRAWKFTLQLSTACPPGVDDDIVDANDHARARAVYGGLTLM